ncbi:MAG: hypothetical protein Q7V00_05760 [Sulfurimicrobium sp.]|nr:hypothetical protein [Sulfurimicrobium sp.]MDP1705969.1 hypothetical protein [Sulfurimicrobium sp.]MDP2200035.1 hypothetical protein [Sulfurimicrobium sp.]MDP3687707.1 hypothetical protein [Sulfurimicrobium sp.]
MSKLAPEGPVPSVSGLYAGRRVALLTQHGKERVIAPVLDAALGCRVERVSGFDTDTLGSFTREIPRAGTQLDAARRKARIGMELSGLPLGLASEGAFGPDPMTGLFPWNVELLVFIDDERGIEVTGMAQQAARMAHLLTGEWEKAEQFARQAGFPGHHMVLRPQGQDGPRIEKGIDNWVALEAAFQRARSQADNGLVFLENDVRAHAHPTRMEAIRMAAEDLVARLNSPCPACGTPGFWIVERVAGLPCGDCGMPTREIRALVYGCRACGHRDRREHAGMEHADPGRCDNCNP